MKTEIKSLSINEEREFESSNSRTYFKLDIYSKAAAKLLIYLNYWLLSNCDRKSVPHCSRFYVTSPVNSLSGSSVVGGGLLVKGDPEITTNVVGCIGIHFLNYYKMCTSIRSGNTSSEIAKLVKSKIAYSLKTFWKAKAGCDDKSEEDYVYKMNNTKINDISASPDAYIDITYNDYRILYENLLGRDVKKSIEKYTQESYDKMIGKPMQDQILLTAIEAIENEMKAVETAFLTKKDHLFAQEDSEKKAITIKYRTLVDEAATECKAKTAELQKQMEMLKANGMTSAE